MRSSLSLFRLCAVGLTLSLTGVLMSRCGSRGGGEETAAQAVERHPLPDTLRIGTLYSPTSYFIYRDQEMGYDYSLISQWAEEKDMVVDLKVAPSLPRLIEMLDSAEGTSPPTRSPSPPSTASRSFPADRSISPPRCLSSP